ncbi:hypothetical protein [Paractinoplanes hotanensis]|uniref:Uncharacterized protein n=1 Tax=Paractinoplanes hotanensis TaxID=2906497 RepID=A0ABT0Y898_9ACTN|nr:hypothetical protein [Actinoplanes hotanensis]MCM4082276.1 hypothetical protein [Actinoplanes hotanensis]
MNRQHDVLEFLAGLHETLDAEHYLGRVAGSIDRLDHRIYHCRWLRSRGCVPECAGLVTR